jgi:hypothetical protein
MPLLNVFGTQFLQRNGPEVRDDLTLAKFTVTFDRFWRPTLGARDPSPDILADSNFARVGKRAIIGGFEEPRQFRCASWREPCTVA